MMGSNKSPSTGSVRSRPRERVRRAERHSCPVSTAEIALIVSIASGLAGAVGVVNSARALRWQKKRDAERRAKRVTIHFGHAAWHESVEPSVSQMVGGIANLPLEYRLQVIVVNASEEAPVFVRGVHPEQAAGDEGCNLTMEETEPTRLEAGEPMVRELFLHHVPVDFRGGVVAKVHLAPDEWIESEVEPLMEELMRHVDEHNRRGHLDAPPES